jgi:DNA primase
MDLMPPKRYEPTDYYREVAAAIATHLAGIEARRVPMTASPDGPVTYLTAPTHLVAIHLVPGAGADTATAATAALQLAEQCAADGLVPVPLTDADGGLWILARTTGDAPAAALRYAGLLTATAPELATADPAAADGRCLVTVPGADQVVVPVPYTALPGESGWHVAIPLHLDEVAAVAAGMPAEFDAAEVGDRLGARGDLAAGLLAAAPR